MWGTSVNALAIILGAFFGIFLGKYLKENIRNTVMQGIGMGVILIGMQMALGTNNILIVIISLVVGGIIGEILKIEYYLDKLGKYLAKLVGNGNKEEQEGKSQKNIAKAFVTTTLVYCIGAMGIIGSLESGLTNNHQTLYAKSLLDGISAIMFASTLGIGVVFSAIPVFLYQGTITLLAGFLQQFLVAAVITELKATGGVLIFGIGLNILGIKEIHVGNLLPSIVIAVLLAIFI